jgi:hypothetical protein
MANNFSGRQDAGGVFSSMVEGSGLVKADSMEITNDPRFFTGNVLDKRLGAFHIAGMVSVLMVKVAAGNVMKMKKDWSWATFDPRKDNDGIVQILGFALLNLTLYLNVITVYVTIAQMYHTYRLMTAGPTGFEMAASYYLNRNVTFWRHFGIMCMFISFPTLLISCGLRLTVKFDKDSSHKATWVSEHPTKAPLPDPHVGSWSVFGMIVCATYLLVAFFLTCIHLKHVAVFRERYNLAVAEDSVVTPLRTHVQEVSARGRGSSYLDV